MTDYRDILKAEGHVTEGSEPCPLCWEAALRHTRMWGGRPLDHYGDIVRQSVREAKIRAAAA